MIGCVIVVTFFIVFFIILSIIAIIVDLITVRVKGKENEDTARYWKKKLKKHGVVFSSKIEFSSSTNSWQYVVIADEVHQELHILRIDDIDVDRECISFYDIIGTDVRIRNKHDVSVSRAIIGSILAGETGALIGSMSGSEKITEYDIVIFVRNIKKPRIILSLIDSSIKVDSPEMEEVLDFTNEINSLINAIVANSRYTY